MILDPVVFMAALTAVNTEMASYIFASIGADERWPDQAFPPDREQALGDQMVALGDALRERAQGRRLSVDLVRPAEPEQAADSGTGAQPSAPDREE